MPRPPKPDPDHVPNQDALAERLGVTRKTVGNWLRQGAPRALPDGRYNVPAWEEWVAANGKSGDDDMGPDLKAKLLELKVEKEEQAIRRLRIDNDKEDRLLIPRKDVEIMLMSVWVGLNTFIQTLPGRLMLATRGVSDDLEKQEIYQRQADQMIRIINEFAEHLEKQDVTSITWECGNLRQLFDSLRGRVEQA